MRFGETARSVFGIKGCGRGSFGRWLCGNRPLPHVPRAAYLLDLLTFQWVIAERVA